MRQVVLAALIARGKLLVERRQAGVSFAGQWGCPGGKVERGEGPLEALRREIREELCIEVLGEAPVIAYCTLAPPVISEETEFIVYSVTSWSGIPTARVASELRWVSATELGALDLTPVNEAMIAALCEAMDLSM